MTQIAKFKYTFPITKAEKRADGIYITGYASGPEVDSEGERMAPEAIERFAAQINDTDTDTRLVYRDAHAPDGVLRDLGDITKAWVTEKFHLGIEVKLDEANPAAVYLYKQLDKGKQYGMSVAGHVVDYVDEFIDSANTVVRTYKNVVLDEISNTTRPAWYPSFGSVLSKSVKDATSAGEGDTALGKEVTGDLVVEDAAKSDEAEATEDTTTKAADEVVADSTEKAADDAAVEDTTEKAADAASDEDVEKAGRRVSAATAAELRAMHEAITNALTAVGVIEAPAAAEGEAEKSADNAGEATTEKSSASTDAESTELAELRKALEQATARIATLEAQPTAQVPGAITDTTKSTDELGDLLAKASPAERLRIAMAAHTGGR
jgi:phage head maturation protease